MRRLFKLCFVLFLAAAAYVAWPLYTALQIRDAMRTGDSATLARKVEWERVRATLKASMSPEAIAALEADPSAPKPTLWQRVKSTIAPHVAGTVIDRYATPEYFPVLLGYRRIWRGTTQPAISTPDPPTQFAGTLLADTFVDRFVAFYPRIRRAVFYSPTHFEIEVVDRHRADRSFVGTLELKGFEWKLVGLTIVAPKAAGQP